MHILLVYATGLRKWGLLLAVSPDQLRVVIPGMADAIGFRRMDGVWMAESGAVVEIAAAEPVMVFPAPSFGKTARRRLRAGI